MIIHLQTDPHLLQLEVELYGDEIRIVSGQLANGARCRGIDAAYFPYLLKRYRAGIREGMLHAACFGERCEGCGKFFVCPSHWGFGDGAKRNVNNE